MESKIGQRQIGYYFQTTIATILSLKKANLYTKWENRSICLNHSVQWQSITALKAMHKNIGLLQMDVHSAGAAKNSKGTLAVIYAKNVEHCKILTDLEQLPKLRVT